MFIKTLKISKGNECIREISFHKGLNLIVDNSPLNEDDSVIYHVGKTTVLKLISFCLCGDTSYISSNIGNNKEDSDRFRNYLINNKILITLVLTEDLDDINSKEVVIERNFQLGKNALIKINGKKILKRYFESELASIIFPKSDVANPSFIPLITHNFRYSNHNLHRALKTLNRENTEEEYDSLYLYILSITFKGIAKKQSISTQINEEYMYRLKLLKGQNVKSYEIAIADINREISNLNKEMAALSNNDVFMELNNIRYKKYRNNALIESLNIRKDIILDTQKDMDKQRASIDERHIEQLYREAKTYLPNIRKNFDDLALYHNEMMIEKTKFATQEIPSLTKRIENKEHNAIDLNKKEGELLDFINTQNMDNSVFDILEKLDVLYMFKCDYEVILNKIKQSEINIQKLEKTLNAINQELYSDEFEERLKTQINKFNEYFVQISKEIYDEQYVLNFNKEINRNTDKTVYNFNVFNLNLRANKKQGESLCFDLAYIKFTNEERFSCLHFLLNENKDLLDYIHLLKVSNFINQNNIQLVIPLLSNKIEESLLDKSNIVLELSKEDKLFKADILQ